MFQSFASRHVQNAINVIERIVFFNVKYCFYKSEYRFDDPADKTRAVLTAICMPTLGKSATIFR